MFKLRAKEKESQKGSSENTKMRVSLHMIFALVLVAGWQVNECFGAASSSKSIADTDTTTTYSSLQPPKYNVELGYIIDGVESFPPACPDYAPGSSCLEQVDAGQNNSLVVRYSVKEGYSVNLTSTVRIQACYGPDNIVDRPWRKFNDVIANNKQCSADLGANLRPEGSFAYVVGPNSAPSVYSVEVIEVCEDGSYCAMGTSPGYFQVQPINSRPSWLMALTGVFSVIGPSILVGFFVWEYKVKKA